MKLVITNAVEFEAVWDALQQFSDNARELEEDKDEWPALRPKVEAVERFLRQFDRVAAGLAV